MEKVTPKGGKRPGAGRPRKYGRALLSEQTLIWSTKGQKAAWKSAAQSDDKEFTDWVRDSLDGAAKIQQSRKH